MLEITSADGLF